MNFSQEHRDKEQDRTRENRVNFSQKQREKEVVKEEGEKGTDKGNEKAGEEVTSPRRVSFSFLPCGTDHETVKFQSQLDQMAAVRVWLKPKH